MGKEVHIPCVLNGLLEEKKDCPGSCPLRPYVLDIQEYQITVDTGNKLIALRRDKAEQGISPHASLSNRSMLDDCINASLVMTLRQER